MKPKECINKSCNNVFYIEEYKIHLPIQCETCINKKKENEKNSN